MAVHAVGSARRRANIRLATGCVLLVLTMGGLAFASAPAYRLFCQLTGYEGTPRVAVGAIAPGATGRQMVVRLDASLNQGMPWRFVPEQREVRVPIGEQSLVSYLAHNPTSQPVTGRATFNVTPEKAAAYVAKVACFCFTEQTLAPQESAHMPVSFYIDPAILQDPQMSDVTTITLSYTFFRADAS